MIEYENGHWRSVRTRQEGTGLLERDLETLSTEERATIEHIVAEIQNPAESAGLLQTLGDLEWVRTPVDMKTFCTDPFYLGNTCDTIYPTWLSDLTEIFSGDYREAVFTGAIGTGKTFAASIGICRLLYILSCMRDPHRSFGIAANSNISIVCLSGDTEIFDGYTGERVRLDSDIGNDRNVVGFDGRRLIPATSKGVIRTGRKPVFELRTSTGRRIKATADHKFLTLDDGWAQVKDLREGQPVALAAYLPEPCQAEDTLSDAELKLLGYLVSEGSTKNKHVQFGNTDKRLIEEYVEAAMEIGCHDVTVSEGQDKRPNRKVYYNARERAGKRGQRGVVYRLETLCAEHGLLGKGADEKRIPPKVMQQSNRGLALFLNRLYSGDGSVHLHKRPDAQSHQNWKNFQCRYATTSPLLAQDVADALLRFGIYATVRYYEPGRGWNPAYYVEFSRKEFIQLFVHHVGLFGRERCCEGADWKGFSLTIGDVCWDEVVSIEPKGEEDTYCVQDVEGQPWFVANGFITHNCLSVNEILATKVAYENIATKIEASPYFQENFPFDKTKKELRFPRKVWVAARASNDGSVLGLNVISCLLDETNFMPKASKGQDPRFNLQDRAEVLYNAIYRRMKSRFDRKGRLPGILFVVSSKQTNDDFTARRIRESILDPKVFVRDYALWQTKPEEYYSGDWFHVVVGNEQAPSRIIGREEDIDEVRVTLPEDCVVMEVPEDFRGDFENDLEGSIRDLAGVATVSVSPYIQRRTKIIDAIRPEMRHPFSVQVYDPSQPGKFYWHKMLRPASDSEGGMRPILSPYAPRHIHIDPSMTGDATGFAMGHISGWREVVRRDDEGNKYPERAPEIMVDVVLRIVPPIGGEIILGDVRKLVYQLGKHGYMITCVSIDSWNSADAIQKLNQKGYNAIQLSVDRTMGPYDLLKSALYENRLYYYEYEPLLQELRELEHDRVKRKVDHPLRGCFVGATRIPLLDGTHPCIWELEGKEVWVYSARPDGTIVPGRARGRRTKVTDRLVDVVLDSGAVERCTPEHLWMLRDGSYKEARHLRPGIDRLMPINRQWPVNGGYERLSDKNRAKVLTHHAVWSAMHGKAVPQGCCVHHLNRVKTDNRPENLEVYLLTEHAREHTRQRHKQDPEWRERLYEGARRFNESPEGRAIHSEALKRTVAARTDEEWKAAARKHKAFRADIDEAALERVKHDPEATNANAAARILGCGRNVVVRVLGELGFSTWGQFRDAETGDNHKVREVVPVRTHVPIPVYDLEVQEHSNFALCSGVFVHNSKDLGDAVAGIVWTLTENSSSLPLAILKSSPDHGDAWMLEHQQAALARSYGSEDAADMGEDFTALPPFLIGSGDN